MVKVLEGESLFNDVSVLFIYCIVVGVVVIEYLMWSEVVLIMVLVLVGSVVVGLFVGYFVFFFMEWLKEVLSVIIV